MHSPNEDKLNLNSFLNIIYSSKDEDTSDVKTQPTELADDRFRTNFAEEEYDVNRVSMTNINDLGAYQLDQALCDGQKMKNKLQKYLKSPA